MARPHLALQYPDLQTGKVRLLAITESQKALSVFRDACLEEARLNLITCEDGLLRIAYQQELTKLEKLFAAIVPVSPEESLGR